MPSLHEHELVWGYVRGFPSWPGVIEKILSNGKYKLHFFGDYTRADINRKSITHFFEGFNEFSSNYNNIKLQKAIEEAKIFLFDLGKNPQECYVCQVLAFKDRLYERKEK